MAGDRLVDPWQSPTEGLSLRRPGEGALEEAARIRRAHPVATWLMRLLGVHTDERAWRIGGRGEQGVGADLDRLPTKDWLVLHDLTLSTRGANLDHLVVGPPGVFTINTKNHPGKKVWVASRALLVNGHKTSYLPKAVDEAARVERGIAPHTAVPFSVRPVLAILCKEWKIEQRPADVAVIRGGRLRRWLLRLPVTHRGSALWRLRHDVGEWARVLDSELKGL
jgi:hypothetical protein